MGFGREEEGSIFGVIGRVVGANVGEIWPGMSTSTSVRSGRNQTDIG